MSAHPRPQLLQEQGVTIVAFGDGFKTINEDHVPDAGEVLVKATEQDPPLLVIDLDGVEFFSSSFIEVLFRVWNRLKKRHGHFALCNLFPYCKEVLKITNLHTLWKICGTRAEAIAWLQQQGSGAPPAA